MKIYILIIFTFVVLQLVQGLEENEKVGTLHKNIEITPADLVIINNKTYFFSNGNTRVNVEAAMLLCNDFGMSLVNLETQEEYVAVSRYLVNNGAASHIFWTSGRPISVTESELWSWSGSGQMFTYANWMKDEPSHSNCAMCVALIVNYGYMDDDCTKNWSFICESN